MSRRCGARAARAALAALAALVLLSCGEEPGRLVSAQTDDGLWELTLDTRDNALKRGESIAVRVRLVSLAGQPAATFQDTIHLLANAGSVLPSRLVFTFVGRLDTTSSGQGITTVYSDWVTFTLSTLTSQAHPGRQGEVIALFRDVEAVLKLRIVED